MWRGSNEFTNSKNSTQTKDTQITNELIQLLAQRGGKTFRWCLTWENVSGKLAAGDNKRGKCVAEKLDAEKFGRWCKTREKVSMVRTHVIGIARGQDAK